MIEISIEIGMLNFGLGLLVTALMKETYFKDKLFSRDYEFSRMFSMRDGIKLCTYEGKGSAHVHLLSIQ